MYLRRRKWDAFANVWSCTRVSAGEESTKSIMIGVILTHRFAQFQSDVNKDIAKDSPSLVRKRVDSRIVDCMHGADSSKV